MNACNPAIWTTALVLHKWPCKNWIMLRFIHQAFNLPFTNIHLFGVCVTFFFCVTGSETSNILRENFKYPRSRKNAFAVLSP